jgi:ketosteroid isomerase-like protein
MNENEKQIREQIESWAAAIRGGELEDVVAGRADDIVMFDVPPPYEGVRGIDAYREAWPPFFQYLERGSDFDILSLSVEASEEVAFAFALLRCGSPEEVAENPDNRLRLTLGLRRENGDWVVAHEHHSFADPS